MPDISTRVIGYEKPLAIAAVNNYKLTGATTGTCVSKNTCYMYKYNVTPGEIIYLLLSDIGETNSGTYQWQKGIDVPTSGTNANLVGTPVTGDVDAFVEVPETATYLIISQLKTNMSFKVCTTLAKENAISEMVLPNTESYDIKDTLARQTIPFGTTDYDSTNVNFKATVPGVTELKSGVYCYIMNTKVTSATDCTLNVNGLGAKPMYMTTALASRVTSQFAVNYTWMFVYNEYRVQDGCWDLIYLFNTNTTYSTFSSLCHGNAAYKAKSALYRYQMLFQIDKDYLTPLNNNNNVTAATKTMLTDVEFDPFGEILYYSTSTALDPEARIGATSALFEYGAIDLRYTFNCASTLTSFEPIYLKVIIQSNGKAKIATDQAWAQELPSTNDGYHYIFLGRTYSAYQMALFHYHPIYYHDGTKICIYDDSRKRNSSYYTKDEIDDIAESKSNLDAYLCNTTTGAIVSFDDAADNLPVDSLICAVDPIQSGSGDACPPGGGKNKFGPNTYYEESTYLIEDGDTGSTSGWVLSDYIAVVPSTTYTFKPNSTEGGAAKHGYYTNEKVFISAINSGENTFTTPSNCYYMRFSYRDTSTEIQLEIGSTATSYASYTNIRQMTGVSGIVVNYTGKNMLSLDELIAASSGTIAGYTFKHKLNLYVKPNTTFTLSTSYSGNNVLYFNGASSSNVAKVNSPVTVTTADDGLLSIALYDRTGIELFENKEVTVQLEMGSEVTDYETYRGKKETISWEDEPGAVYGALPNITTGELPVTRNHLEITGDTITTISTASHGSNYIVAYTASISDMKMNTTNCYCDTLKIENRNSNFSTNCIVHGRNNNYIYICMETRLVGNTLDSFKAYLNSNPIHTAYELANPVMYDFTPRVFKTSSGVNNIWSNVGNITVTYKTNNAKYFSNTIGDIETLLAAI